MSDRRLTAFVLAATLSLVACTTGAPSPGSTPAGSDRASATRVEVRTESVTPPAPPAPPSREAPAPTPVPTSPTLSVGPVRPPEPAPAAQPPAPPQPPPSSAPATANIVFNFDNADVEVVIQAAAEIVGFNYVLAPAVRGKKVTVQTIGRIAADDVFNVLLTILDVNGLAAVRSGNLYRIIAREGAPQAPVRIVVGRDIPPRTSDEIVTQIVPLKYIAATDAVNLLRPFVAQQGAVTSHRETNLLIITDTAANIRRLLDILKLADVQVALDELQVIPIKNADAQELSLLLNQMFATGRLRTGAAALGLAVTPPPPPAAGLSPTGAPASAGPAGTAAGQSADRAPLIVAERRSNSLVVHARKQELETIQQLVAKLDIDIYGGQRVFVYFADYSKAKDLAATLESIYGRPAAQGTTRSPVAPPSLGSQSPLASQAAAAAAVAIPRVAAAGALEAESSPGMGDLRFIADEITNAIIVTTYPRRWKDVSETIKTLDRLARQVLIEVLVAEVVLTDDTKLGIEWAVRNGKFVFTNTQSGVVPSRPNPGLIPGAGSLGGGLVPTGFNIYAFAAGEFIAALNALATENKVNILSSPSIMTSENKKAIINVSTSVPIVTSQQVPVAAGGTSGFSITQSVEYKDVGIILTVTPRIGEHGTVALEVKQEVNDVIALSGIGPNNSPSFSKREAETSVVLLNNQTLVMGGLIQNKRTFIRNGLPFLSKIPVFGYLFGSTEEKIEKTELLLLITPRVIGTALDAARVTDQMRKVTPELEQSFKLAPPRPPSTTAPPTPPAQSAPR